MNPAILNIPFIQVALPIMVTLIGGIWLNSKSMDTMNKRIDDTNKRLDDMNRNFNSRFDEIFKRFDNIDSFIRDHSERITRLEERSSLLVHR